MKSNAKRAKVLLETHSTKMPECEELFQRVLVDLEGLDAIKQCAEHQRIITDDVSFFPSLQCFLIVFVRLHEHLNLSLTK